MAWNRIGEKPLSEPMLTRFTDAYMWHYGEGELNEFREISKGREILARNCVTALK